MSQKDIYKLQFGEEVSIIDTQELVQDLTLDTVEIGYTGGVSGIVVNGDGTPVNEATVKVFDNNFTPIKHTMTDGEGKYNISGLEAGTYVVHAIKDGYSLSKKITVAVNDTLVEIDELTITMNAVISRGILYGIVYSKMNVPLSAVEITLSQIVDEEEVIISQAVSATDGEYMIYDIEPGRYQLYAVSEDYFLDEKVEVVISASTNTKEYLYLSRRNTAKQGTINGYIRDRITLAPLANACVGLYDISVEGEENLVSITFTDREGKYFFGHVTQGKYIVKSKVSS